MGFLAKPEFAYHTRMKIGLFGHGKMGTLVGLLAEKRGDTLVDPSAADVCIDFSHASVVLNHVQWAVEHHKPLVIGTTGWENDHETARKLIEKSNTAALASPNFSLGMACFIKLLQQARTLFKEYAVAGIEHHHSEKKDAPSGTAKQIANTLNMKTPFTSVRCGRIPGKHEVLFDSPFDSITLTHEAHNRESFASGALTAASWIQTKKGWYTLDEMLRDLYGTHLTL